MADSHVRERLELYRAIANHTNKMSDRLRYFEYKKLVGRQLTTGDNYKRFRKSR